MWECTSLGERLPSKNDGSFYPLFVDILIFESKWESLPCFGFFFLAIIFHGGLKGNGPRRLVCLNIWSPGAGTVWN